MPWRLPGAWLAAAASLQAQARTPQTRQGRLTVTKGLGGRLIGAAWWRRRRSSSSGLVTGGRARRLGRGGGLARLAAQWLGASGLIGVSGLLDFGGLGGVGGLSAKWLLHLRGASGLRTKWLFDLRGAGRLLTAESTAGWLVSRGHRRLLCWRLLCGRLLRAAATGVRQGGLLCGRRRRRRRRRLAGAARLLAACLWRLLGAGGRLLSTWQRDEAGQLVAPAVAAGGACRRGEQ